jgi:hypothetical protein
MHRNIGFEYQTLPYNISQNIPTYNYNTLIYQATQQNLHTENL